MALALGGVGLAIGAPSDAGDPVGLGFAFAGVLIGAFASVFVKRLEVGAVALQAWAALASLGVMLPATLALESGQAAAVTAAPLAAGAVGGALLEARVSLQVESMAKQSAAQSAKAAHGEVQRGEKREAAFAAGRREPEAGEAENKAVFEAEDAGDPSGDGSPT